MMYEYVLICTLRRPCNVIYQAQELCSFHFPPDTAATPPTSFTFCPVLEIKVPLVPGSLTVPFVEEGALNENCL